MTARFEPVLTLNIRDLGTKEFSSWDQVRDWTQSELQLWEPWTKPRLRLVDGWRNECITPLHQLADLANECIAKGLPVDFSERVRQISDSFASGPAVVSDSATGRRVLWYLDSGKQIEATIYVGVYLNRRSFNLHNMANDPYDFVIPLISVVSLEAVQDASWEEVQSRNSETFKAVLDDLRNSADQRLQSFNRMAGDLDSRIERITKGVTQVWKIVKKASDDAASRRASLEETYETKLRLAAPAGYWRDRAQASQKASYWAIGAFVGLLAALSVLGFCFGPALKAFLADKDGKLEIAAIALLAPVFIIILGLFRIVARSHLINQNHAMECRQRETMMSTFLSLTNDQSAKITDAERLIVLQALFRPSGVNAEVESLPSNILEAGLNALKNPKS